MWFEKGYSDEVRSFIYNTKADFLFSIIDKILDENSDKYQAYVNDSTRGDNLYKANYGLGIVDFIDGFANRLEKEIKKVLEEMR